MRDAFAKLPNKSRKAADVLLRVGIYVIGGYALFKLLQGALFVGSIPANVKNALGSVGSALGSGLFDLFHPDQVGESLFYTPTFADGSRHAIASREVNALGQFTYQNTRYQLLTGRDGMRYAVKV